MSAFDFKDIVDVTLDVVIITKATPLDHPGPEIVYVNKAFTELTGYTAEEVIGKTPRILQSGGTDSKTTRDIRLALERKEPIKTTIKNLTKTGQEYWLELNIFPLKNKRGKVTHFAAIQRDASLQKSLEKKLDQLTERDELTGLLNRRAFDQMINSEFLRYLRTHNKFSVLLIDLDNFKKIDEEFGQSACEQALINLANLFELLFRAYDHAVRLGGDQFCVVLPDSSQVKALIGAERLRHMVERNPLSIEDDDIRVTVSIGVAEVDEDDQDFNAVLSRADKALDKAKRKGRNRVCKFSKG